MQLLRTTIARSAAEMDGIAPVWNRLISRQSHSIFQRFSWNRLAADMFRDRLQPYVVCVESESGATIVPAAINRTAHRIELLGECLFDYRDVLHSGGPGTHRAAWQRIAEVGLPLEVCGIPVASGERWPEFPLRAFCRAPEVSCEEMDEKQFRSAHSRLGRHFRRLQKQGVSLHHSKGDDSELMRELYRRKGEQFATDASNVFCDPMRREFMVAVGALESEGCDILTLQKSAGVLIAGIVAFRDGSTRRFYTTYFDPEWARFSPGVVLLFEVTARSLAEGLSCDYMTGEYPYKMRFANSSRELHKLEISSAQLSEVTSSDLLQKAV